MIALLCPTRGRPEQFKRMCESAKKTASTQKVHIYSGTNGDTCGYEEITTLFQKDAPTAYMWNGLSNIARMNGHKLYMLCADDVIFATPGWDEALINHYEALENKVHVYAFQDSRDVNGTPHPIVTREYMDAMGYFVPPIFLHWNVDTWTVEIARANNCFTHLKDYLLIHDKPSDQGKPDETHTRIRAMGWHARDMYVAESCKHFLEIEKKRLADAKSL